MPKRTNYLSWEETFVQLSYLVAQRSKDPNTQAGAVIVNHQNVILGVGYNGWPRGINDDDLPWDRDGGFMDTKYAYVVHAEENAIYNTNQANLHGSRLYCTLFPCNECAKTIIQAGIKEIIYLEDKYSDLDIWKASKRMLDLAGVKYRQYQPQFRLKLETNQPNELSNMDANQPKQVSQTVEPIAATKPPPDEPTGYTGFGLGQNDVLTADNVNPENLPALKRSIYALEGLAPEVRAVTFAKCSRSPESFAEIAKELTEEKSSEFHEKWVVNYGHGSVAEHAVLSMAIENISILATKVIEDNRLSSYTEKSTRYQVFDKTKVYKPQNVMISEFGNLYEDSVNWLMDTYSNLMEKTIAYVRDKVKQGPDEKSAAYLAKTKALACDNVRYVLPTATLTNLGMTANARVFEHAIVKLLSHPLEEMREIGEEIKDQGLKICPTLIKYANKNEYLSETPKQLQALEHKYLPNIFPEDNQDVILIDYDREAENKLVASLLYPHSLLNMSQLMQKVREMADEQKAEIIDKALEKMDQHDWPLREFEHIYYTMDILMDYGAFRDIQRHRIATQTNQLVTCDHGYSTPPLIVEAGYENEYKHAMDRAAECYYLLRDRFPFEAQYVVPLAYKKRTLFTWNLRELHHFIKLRTTKHGHFSYRRIAQQCWQRVHEVHPNLAKYIRVNMDPDAGFHL